MAAYYHGGAGTDIQASTDGLQTLYLMNPSYAAGYADAAGASTPGATSMMLLNSAVSTMTPASFGHHQQSPSSAAQQHFVGIPLQAPPSGYNLWTTASAGAADMSPTAQAQTPGAAGVSAVLSLSSRDAPPVTVAAVAAGTDEGKYMLGVSATSQGQMVMNSKYLKAAQELLDEVVSVSKGMEDTKPAAAAKSPTAVKKKEESEGMSGGGTEDGGGAKSSGAPEMSTAERQELQMKKSKLINMLDEVEQRYRQYHGQMQAVSSSFEAAAGAGSARTYTALALRTISRQFRCLRDAIAAQVRAASRALGEDADAAVGGGRTVGSRLRYIDHHLRQQRALQQLGMMQGGAWRPQRGLPERSVSILRAWLFEHFLHPYPKDSDKIMLAKQTGLTRSQVSNWFINARVRLWKPMVEEMYLEETKDQDGGNDDGKSGGGSKQSGDTNNGAEGVTPRADGAMSKSTVRVGGGAAESAPNTKGGILHGTSLLELAGDQQAPAGFYNDDEDDDVGAAGMERRLKKARGDEPAAGAFHGHHHVPDMASLHAQAAAAARQQHEEVSHRELLMKFMESGGAGAGARDHHHHQDGGGYSLFAPGPSYGQFGSEPFAFAGNGGVSLTLGLPHGAGGGAEQTASFLMGSTTAGDSGGHGGAGGYDMNMQSTKSFAAQLMRDFVA
ncbi:hypothetical protein BS78_05G059900 [Paspalum vaginatum]|nr:hypothetical protein BS78_05G059900 [Paspalum vaginatum]KAJ1274412.1 hypothetical protein BS78_05G059900 [Paspalum vaginatum]